MKKHVQPIPTFCSKGPRCFWLPLLTLFLSGNAWGTCLPDNNPNIDFGLGTCGTNYECSYAFKRSSDPDALDIINPPLAIEPKNLPAPLDPDIPVNTTWAYEFMSGNCTNDPDTAPSCLGAVMINNISDTTPSNAVTLTGTASVTGGSEGHFKITGTASNTASTACSRQYKLRITTDGGGWGDPHITTVDGVKYDFQSAGEFTLLRGNNLEIQTRQTPVSTSHIPRPNAYTGIASCVSVYTAIAAKVGSHKVSIQPALNRVADSNGLELRVDGVVRSLGADGIELASCDCDSDKNSRSGRIVKSADGKGYEIRYADGTKLVVTPGWWEAQQVSYMNIEVFDTTASEGIMGRTVDDWLPALSDGSSVGQKAEDSHERYVQLYKTFADSWRVGGENPSLFHYAPHTSTQNFTSDWPKENPSSCLIAGQPVAEPVSEAVAKEHCSDVEDETNQENCVFDVMATGHAGFADTYVRSEQVIPGATRTSITVDKTPSKPGTKVSFTAEVMRKASTIARVTSGRIQFILDGNKVGDPIALDNNGNAVWSTSDLKTGKHEIEARFIPSGFGEQFRTSNSPKIGHLVSEVGINWRVIFLIILILAVLGFFIRNRCHRKQTG